MCKFYAIGSLAFMVAAVTSCGPPIYQPPTLIESSKNSVLIQLEHKIITGKIASVTRTNTATEQDVHEMANRECEKHGKIKKFRIRSCDQAVSVGLGNPTRCIISNYLFDCESTE